MYNIDCFEVFQNTGTFHLVEKVSGWVVENHYLWFFAMLTTVIYKPIDILLQSVTNYENCKVISMAVQAGNSAYMPADKFSDNI